MFDRTFIIILILFLLVGLYAYERFAIERGEVSPVGQLLDFAGLSKFLAKESLDPVTTHRTYQINLKDHLVRLREKHLLIEDQRNQLIYHRWDILKRLESLTEQFEEEAKIYEEVLRKEEKEFLDHFPQIESLGESLSETQKLKDQELREQRYQEIKSQLIELLAGMADNPQEDLPRLNQILDQLQEVVTSADFKVNACENKSQEECLLENYDQLETEIKDYINRIVEGPQKDFEKILELTRVLTRELTILGENLEASELRLQEGNELMESELKVLTEELVQVSEEDLRKLMELYQELRLEQEILLDNLKINQQRIQESYQKTQHQFREIMDQLKNTPQIDFSQLSRSQDDFFGFSEGLINELEVNENQLSLIFQNHWSANKNFIEDFAQAIDADLRKLVEKREHLQEQNAEYTQRRLNSNNIKDNSELRTRASTSQPGINRTPRDRSRIRQQSHMDEQLQKARDKAKDQGFYD